MDKESTLESIYKMEPTAELRYEGKIIQIEPVYGRLRLCLKPVQIQHKDTWMGVDHINLLVNLAPYSVGTTITGPCYLNKYKRGKKSRVGVMTNRSPICLTSNAN